MSQLNRETAGIIAWFSVLTEACLHSSLAHPGGGPPRAQRQHFMVITVCGHRQKAIRMNRAATHSLERLMGVGYYGDFFFFF